MPGLPGAQAGLAGQPVEIEAQYLYYDKNAEVYHAQGQVVIRQKGLELKADKAVLNQKKTEFEAWGEVLLRDQTDYLACRYLKFNYVDQLGSIRDGRIFIKEKNYYITGEEIEKTGPEQYDVKNATLTTCDAERAAWLIRCRRVQVKEGGFGVVDRAVFAIKNVPVFYLPKGVFPVNTKRQTGFLLPGLGYSDEDGVIVKNAFFWAISPSQDLTLYPEIYSERGIKFGAEYRYVINEEAKGDISAAFISDRLVDDEPASYPDAERERWALGAHHLQHLQNGLRLQADVNLVSDNEYLDDFPDSFAGNFIDELANLDYKTETYLRSTAATVYIREKYSATVEARYYQSLLKDSDDAILQLLPEITLAARRQPLAAGTLLLGRAALTYSNFFRREGERGHRLDFNPEVSLPLKLGAFELIPWLEGWGTWYELSERPDRTDGSESRLTMAAGLELKTVAEKVYDFDWWGMDRLLHTIEPTVAYRYRPEVDQDDLPSFDDLDYLPEESNVSWGFISRLVGRYQLAEAGAAGGDQYDYHEWLKFELGQAYSFIDVADGERFLSDRRHASDFYSRLELTSRGGGLYAKFENEFDPYENGNQLLTALLAARSRRGDFFTVEYRYEDSVAEVVTGSARLPLWYWLDVYGSIRYSIADAHLWETIYGFNYHPQCWSLDFSVDEERDPDDRSFRLLLSFSGLGGLGSSN